MGQNWSRRRDMVHYDEEFVVIANASDWCLKFDGSKSHGICVGIDISLQNGSIQPLDDTAAKSAMLVREAIAGRLIPYDQIHECSLERQSYLHTREALRDHIKTNANKVHGDGVFIFYFAGHAFLHKNEWVLAVTNDDASAGITASDLMEWIVTPECQAHHILIVLDCCCAGIIGQKLVEQVQGMKANNQEVHVMCSFSTANAPSPVKILGGSIFSYFLSSTLKQQAIETGFDIKSSMNKVADLCHSFCTLILDYTRESGLISLQMLQQPSLESTLNDKLWKTDDIDYCPSVEALDNLRDRSLELPKMHVEVINWLKSSKVQESLMALHSKASLPRPLLDGVFSTLLYSVTCLNLQHDPTHVSERNLFVVAATEVILALEDSGHPKINITKHQIKKGLDYYWLPLRLNQVLAEPVEALILDLLEYTHT